MLVYYKQAGVNAVLALILNTIILIAALATSTRVLTLPGIAGVILTIGMAVDSNVLIFERIREELRTGKASAWRRWTPGSARLVDDRRYPRDHGGILRLPVSCSDDGPVKGFAVTLVIGLIANVFTAVFVSKAIFDYELSGSEQVAALSI